MNLLSDLPFFRYIRKSLENRLSERRNEEKLVAPIIDSYIKDYMVQQVHKESRLTERRNEEKFVSVELWSFHIQRSKYQYGP